MASGDLSLTSNSSQEESPDYVGFATDRTIRPSSNSSGSTTANINNNNPKKKYDMIIQQYDQAKIELSNLRRQHSDTNRRCEEMAGQLAYFQERYMAAISQLDATKDRAKYTDVTNDNTRLTQPNLHMERKLRRFTDTINSQEKGNGNAPATFSYYELYTDLSNNKKCEGGCMESEKLLEENQLYKKSFADVSKDRNSLAVENENLRIKLSKAFSELEKTKREKHIFRDARDQLMMQQDKEMEEMKVEMAARANELLMTKIDRNRVEEELNQILSEKDNVLQETQKMSDDLAAVKKELDQKKKDEQKYKNELKNLQQTNSDLLQKLEQLNLKLEKRELLKSRESNWSKEFSESKDDFKEIEKLRKSLEKARSEVEKAMQETETAKSRRDWAISEREKIVQERDSVKTLCDELRKERDKAISDWLSAIRDSEKIKKQQDEAYKEIESLKEQLETQASYSRRSYRWSCFPFEFDDVFNIELNNFHQEQDIGIILDDTNNRQLVCGVTPSSPAFGKLKINDVIVKVNDLDCQSVSKRIVLEAIRTSAPCCKLLICRPKQSKRHVYTVHLNLQNNKSHGLTFETGVLISKIQPNSLASFEPELDVGDRILSINNKFMEGVQSVNDVFKIMDEHRTDLLTIVALKNIHDVGYSEIKRRTTNTSAQTDSTDSVHKSSAKQTFKIAEMINKFRGKIQISKSTTDTDHMNPVDDALATFDSVMSEISDNKRSKRSKKESKDANKSMGTWPRAAILNTSQENPTGTIVQHRKKERAALFLFTGPMPVDKDDTENYFKSPSISLTKSPSGVGIIGVPNSTDIGGTVGSGGVLGHGSGVGIIGGGMGMGGTSSSGIGSGSGSIGSTGNNSSISSSKQMQNRNSNPIPVNLFQSNPSNAFLHRHSLYTTSLEPEPVLLEQSKPVPNIKSDRNSSLMNPNQRVKIPDSNYKYATNHRHHHNHYQNRFSLNLTPTHDTGLIYKSSGQSPQQQQAPNHQQQQHHHQQAYLDFAPKKHFVDPLSPNLKVPFNSTNLDFKNHHLTNFVGNQQQNSFDVISLKSQNSIDSFLSQKSPPPPVHDYPSMFSKRSTHKNVSKYPSDSESIGMEIMMSTSGVGSGSGGGGGIGGMSNISGSGGAGVGVGNSNINSSGISGLSGNIIGSGVGGTSLQNPVANTLLPSPLLFGPNMSSSVASSNSRPHPLLPSFTGHVHPHQHRIRHSSPLTLPASSTHCVENQTSIGNAGGMSSSDKLELDYSLPMHHAYNVSMDYHYQRNRNPPARDQDDNQTNFYYVYENGTFPRKKEHQRFRIPSNPSVTSKGSGVKNSTGSIEHHGSERGSPMPPVHVEILSHGANKGNTNIPNFLCPGDLRRVTIDKSDKPLGITIQCNNNRTGIFVSTVAENSIASRAGLQVGDQLLEVCGLNMRAATNDIAANVLRQCGNSITMLVQYNPEKYDGHSLEQESVSHSGSPTPRNSPRPARALLMPSTSPLTVVNKPIPQTPSLAAPPIKNQKFSDSLENQSDSSPQGSVESIFEEEQRLITLHIDKCKNLGIQLFGGNKVGIFVYDVQPDSPADLAGIRKGDQILEYNGVNLRHVTAEQAANETSKLTDKVTMLVQNNLQKLNQIEDKPGDSFYVRVGFDRTGDLSEDELRFTKDEVLYVDNTIFRGVFGQWRAWKLDAFGHRKECGIIPSQAKIEEELRLLGDSTDGEGGTTRRGSTSARRSFFRRKKHQRSSSRDSKELASFSNTQLSYFSDSGILNDEGTILSYQRVERLDYPVCRPVLVLGPLSECVIDRLTNDFPTLFQHCIMTKMNCSQEAMDEGLQKNVFVDYRRNGNIYECTTVQSIRNICENNRHCILDTCISAVERLQRLQIHPIVLLLRFKSAKQIKEIKDSRYSTDKISAKAAKEMYERALKLESDYKQYISAVIPAGVNITHMSTQIKASVDEEQARVLWVPVSNS